MEIMFFLKGKEKAYSTLSLSHIIDSYENIPAFVKNLISVSDWSKLSVN